jgi:hypothetical protein
MNFRMMLLRSIGASNAEAEAEAKNQEARSRDQEARNRDAKDGEKYLSCHIGSGISIRCCISPDPPPVVSIVWKHSDNDGTMSQCASSASPMGDYYYYTSDSNNA